MTENSLLLSGVVAKAARLQTSPAGINHCQFVLEHRSQQIESDMARQAYCRIQVVVSGEWSTSLTQELTVGKQIKVQGFLNRHEMRNGIAKLVLHAQQIEQIN